MNASQLCPQFPPPASPNLEAPPSPPFRRPCLAPSKLSTNITPSSIPVVTLWEGEKGRKGGSGGSRGR